MCVYDTTTDAAVTTNISQFGGSAGGDRVGDRCDAAGQDYSDAALTSGGSVRECCNVGVKILCAAPERDSSSSRQL